jgi:putative acetyltransferase
MTKFHVVPESPDQPEVIALINELDAYQDTLYPPESRHYLDLKSLTQSNTIFVVARDMNARAVGCGAIVLHSSYGEIKRMYVHPESRGRGIARQILEALESAAHLRDCQELMLETGPYQPAALAFYETSGYKRRGPFGAYTDDPLSVFMQKSLVRKAPECATSY